MKARKCTNNDLREAIKKINEEYEGNVIFNDKSDENLCTRFTLTVKDSKGKGARLGVPWNGKQRRIKAACWHVHGDFFDALFDIAPDAMVYARGKKITKEEGNWEDSNIGSRMNPFYYSEACECE